MSWVLSKVIRPFGITLMGLRPYGGGLQKKYGNWQKYNSRNPIQRLLIRNFLKTVGCLLKESGAFRVADIGCAEGFVTYYLLGQLPELRYAGIDVDMEALRRGPMLHPAHRVQQASIYNIPYKLGAVDLVLCIEVLEHLDSPEMALAELMRVTRRYCLLSVPYEPFFRLANFLRGKNLMRLGDDIDHINHWGKSGFVRFLEASNLVVRTVKRPFPWLVVLAELKK